MERGEAAYASASWPASSSRRCASSSAVNFLPTPANSVSQIVTYSSIKPGTAGSWIWPVAPERRYSCRTMASCSCASSTGLLWVI